MTSKRKKQQLSPRAEGQKRIKLVTGIVKKVKAPLKLLSQLVLQFWMEVGKAIYGCLSPSNYVNTRKEKKPRRVFIYIPPTLYKSIVRPMLDKMAPKEMRERNKSGNRRTWAVTGREKLFLVLQEACLVRTWPEDEIHEGGIAFVNTRSSRCFIIICSVVYPLLTWGYLAVRSASR